MAADFATKWRVDRDLHSSFKCFMRNTLVNCSRSSFISRDMMEVIFRKLKRPKKLDHTGCCIWALHIFFEVWPDDFCRLFSAFVLDCDAVSQFDIAAVAFGKESHEPLASECRCILPLTAILSVCDAAVSRLLNREIARLYPLPNHVAVGGRPGSQCLESAWMGQVCIEKGMDSLSRCSVASMDVRRFYDAIPCLTVVQTLLSSGCDAKLALALIVLQLCPKVTLRVLDCSMPINFRTVGTITGSRVAGCAGLSIIANVIHERAHRWRPLGFQLGPVCLTVATWIDNIFAYGPSALSTTAILDDFARALWDKFRLDIKASSREVMCCKNQLNEASSEWKHVKVLNMLGHFVAFDGGVSADWALTKPRMWAVFYKNSGSYKVQGGDIETKLSLLLRTVFCTVNWKFSRWPFQKTVAVEMDAMQVNMVSMISRVPKNDSEDWVTWVRRRRRLARNVCGRIGFWSEAWAKRTIEWHEHIQRHPGVMRDLLMWHDSHWLQAQRSRFVAADGSATTRNSLIAGRTGTRASGGRPQPRWEEGIGLSKSLLNTRGITLNGSNALSISSRIREAVSQVYQFFTPANT